MRYLYLDNFRGFQNTFVPIKDVNFIVGENSTGKTSVLGLLKLLSSPQFWLQQDFNTDEVNFSHFNDIVSANSINKKSFNVGLIDLCGDELNEDDKDSNLVNAFLMTFSEFEGMPFLKKYTYNIDNKEIRIVFSKSSIKYKSSTINNLLCNETFITETFKRWISSHENDNTGYSIIPTKISSSIVRAPLFIISTIVSDIVSGKEVKKEVKVKNFFNPPIFNNELAWLAPVRSKPKRTYDAYKSDYSPEGDHTPYLIKRILDKESSAKDFKKFSEEIGKESGLFEGISVKQYGRGATSPFELDVIINNKPLSVCSVGYGVSQSLPVFVELFSRAKNTWFAIQQPEVHLHPKAQAALGSVFFSLASSEGKKFFIETHSDYAIDRFRISYRKSKEATKPEAQILYFERKGNGNTIYQLEIGPDGELPSDQPEGYRSFFVKEEMQLLGL